MNHLNGVYVLINESELLSGICEEFRKKGVKAILLSRMSSEAIGGGRIRWLSSVYDPNEAPLYVGSIKIVGRNFDQVQVFSRIIPGDVGAFRWYDLHFCILGDVKGKSKIFSASLRKSFFGKKISWKGRDLAERLNKDSELKAMLTEYGVWTSFGKSNVRVCPDEKYSCVRIVFMMRRNESRELNLMIKRSVECLKIAERIADHIRFLLK